MMWLAKVETQNLASHERMCPIRRCNGMRDKMRHERTGDARFCVSTGWRSWEDGRERDLG